MIRPALLLSLMAGPAAAQDAGALAAALQALAKPEESRVLTGAFAACIQGVSDPEHTATLFEDAGWTRSDDDEMGTISIAPINSEEQVFVTLYDGGLICSVSSETIGTAVAESQLATLLADLGFRPEAIATDDGCGAVMMAAGVMVTQTSTGQDPVCNSATTSDTRFIYP